jgi:glycosyltransferase involved in cell wall biosynthesis/SAM-dependent methyltransferase
MVDQRSSLKAIQEIREPIVGEYSPTAATNGRVGKTPLGDGRLTSVIIPTYNRAYILRDAVESALKQTYSNIEIIVVDDGSSDNTREIVSGLPQERIRYIRHPRNRGCSAAYNTGIGAATGKLVAFLDSDDLWKPDYLERQLGLMSRHIEVDAVFSDTEIRGQSVTPSLIGHMKAFPNLLRANQETTEYVFTGRQIYLCLLEEVPIKPSAFIVKREMFEKSGVFDEDWPSGTDWDIFIRLSRSACFGYTHLPLVVQRRTPDATYETFREQDKQFLLKVFTKEKKALHNDPVALRAINRGIRDHCSNLGHLYLESGRPAKAMAAYWCGFRETRSTRMLMNAASVWLPIRVRGLVKRTMQWHSSAERRSELRSRYGLSVSTFPQMGLAGAQLAAAGIPPKEDYMTLPSSFPTPTAEEVESRTPSTCPVCGHGEGRYLLSAPDRFHGRTEIYLLLRCPACSLVWLDNPPRPEDMEIHYGPDYDRKIAAAGESSPQRWRDRWETLKKYKQGGALLDLGCSSGSFLETLRGPAWDLYGIEISPESAERAKARSGAQIFVGDVLAAPYPPNSFDVVTCFHVLEHMYDPRQIFERVQRWLRPGGIFYFLVPNIDSAGKRIFGTYWYALELPRHLYHFSPRSLRRLADITGLEVASLITGREVFIEYSVHYIVDALLNRVGISRPPLAKAKDSSIPWKVVRKGYRWTILPLLTGLASLAGDGESIHAVFRKNPGGHKA